MNASRNFPHVASAYPRECECLVPSVLAPWLYVPVPDWLLRRTGEYEYLADLDASIWRYVSREEAIGLSRLVAEQLEKNAERIVDEIGQVGVWRSNKKPDMNPNVSESTQEVLAALDSRLSRGWTAASVRHVLETSSRDIVPLVDLLAALEYWGFGADPGWEQQRRIRLLALEVGEELADSSVTRDDPRLGPRVGEIVRIAPLRPKRQRIEEVAIWIADHTHRLEQTGDWERSLANLVVDVACIKRESLSQQIRGVVSCAVDRSRDAHVVMRRHGWDGRPPATLQEVADDEGLTRERVRQICARGEEALSSFCSAPYAPALDAALSLLNTYAPMTSAEAAQVLVDAGILGSENFSIVALIDAARLLGRTALIELRDAGPIEWVCHEWDEPPSRGDLSALRTRAGRLTDARGATTVASLRFSLAEKDGLEMDEESIVSFLPLFEGFEWLDEQEGWFWITGRSLGRNRFLNLLRKALSVAGSLTIEDVQASLRRSRRLNGLFPPEHVLIKMCDRFPGIRVDEGRICADPPLNYKDVLQGTELYIVELLLQMGPAARVEEMWQIAGNESVGRVSFWTTLRDSPTIVRYARSTYGLRGLPAAAADVWEVANKRVHRANGVLRDWGHVSDSVTWMLFKLNSSSLRLGQLPIPAVLRGGVDGDYGLCFQQQELAERAVVRETRLLGLRQLLKSAEAEPGDWVLVAVDVSAQLIYVQVGDEELSLSDDSDVTELVEAGCALPLKESEPAQVDEPTLNEVDEYDAELREESGDDPLAVEVLEALARAPRPLKAKEIARAVAPLHEGPIDRSDVNHLLYGPLSDQVASVGSGLWVLRAQRP